MSTFEERAEALARAIGFSWPLREEELRIEQVHFFGADDKQVSETLKAANTRKSRMFLEAMLGGKAKALGQTDLVCSEIRTATEEFFGPELCVEVEKHPFILGVLRGHRANVWLKLGKTYRAADLRELTEVGWENRDSVTSAYDGEWREANEAALNLLDSGGARVAEPDGQGGWQVNDWLKKAVLLSFRLNDNKVMEFGSAGAPAFDKVSLKFDGWDEDRFREAGIRVVPEAVVRRSAFIGKGAVLMPSFVNLGAYVGEGTMIDTWATVGSCAQIGKNCHISGGAGIGGVLEPLQANPVIIEDNCFIGARSEVAEGVIVGEGSVLSMGVFIGASTKIVDRATGAVTVGKVPPYSVVVPGSLPCNPKVTGGPSLYCAVIVKTVDAQTREKTGINELLRD